MRSIGVISSARYAATVMGIVGLIIGILYSVGGAVYDALVSLNWVTPASSGAWSTPGLSWGTLLAFLALIGMPIIFGLCGLVVGAVAAFLYNVFVKMRS